MRRQNIGRRSTFWTAPIVRPPVALTPSGAKIHLGFPLKKTRSRPLHVLISLCSRAVALLNRCEGRLAASDRKSLRTHLRPDRVSSLPTANGGIARVAYTRALSTGVDIKSLLRRAGLTLRQIKAPDVRIPVRSQIQFLNQVADALQDDFLGIRLAQSIDLRELGLIYYVLASSETLAQALARLARYSAVHNEGVHISCSYHRHLAVSFEYVGVARDDDRHQIEFFISILLRLCRQLSGRRLTPLQVRLSHRRMHTPTELRTFFGCQVDFGARKDQVIFSIDVRDSAIVQADPYLNSLLIHYCDEILLQRRISAGDWTLRVQNAISPVLPHGEATIENAARALGVTPRTLSRRLRQEGVSFAKVLQNLRLQLTRRYFDEPRMSVSQIAWLLGYRDTSAFSHAFKRWTGTSPRRVRLQSARPDVF